MASFGKLVKEGQILKNGNTLGSKAQLRYLKLWDDNTMKYYEDSNCNTLKGTIYLQDTGTDESQIFKIWTTDVPPTIPKPSIIQRLSSATHHSTDNSNNNNNNNNNSNNNGLSKYTYGFTMYTPHPNHRTWYIYADSDTERNSWIESITNVTKKNAKYTNNNNNKNNNDTRAKSKSSAPLSKDNNNNNKSKQGKMNHSQSLRSGQIASETDAMYIGSSDVNSGTDTGINVVATTMDSYANMAENGNITVSINNEFTDKETDVLLRDNDENNGTTTTSVSVVTNGNNNDRNESGKQIENYIIASSSSTPKHEWQESKTNEKENEQLERENSGKHKHNGKKHNGKHNHKQILKDNYETKKFEDFLLNKFDFDSIPNSATQCHCGMQWKLCWATNKEEVLKYISECHICGGSELTNSPEYDSLLEKQIPYFICGNEDAHGGSPFILCLKSFWDEMYIPYHIAGNVHAVGVSIHVSRVGEIDTQSQSFRCRFHLKYSWKPLRDEIEEYEAHKDDEDWVFEPKWKPNFSYPNMIESHFEEMQVCNSNKEEYYGIVSKGTRLLTGDTTILPYTAHASVIIDATFIEVFELENFPLDCQDLTIRISTTDTIKDCKFVTPYEAREVMTMQSEYSTLTEWTLHCPQFETMTRYVHSDCGFSEMNINLKLAREFKAYFTRIGIFLIFINFSSLVSFAFDSMEDGPDKIAYLVTLLLTAVAFQFAVLDSLPKVKYSTFIDYYIQFSFTFIFLLLIESSFAMNDSLDFYQFETEIFYVFLTVFVCAHLYFAYRAVTQRKYEIGKLTRKASQMKNYSKKQRLTSKILGLHKHTLGQKSIRQLISP